MPGELQQAPAEQQADRQAADVAEKYLRHRPVERRKAEHRAAERRGDDHRRRRGVAEPAEQGDGRGDRYGLGDRHQVQPIHEVDEIDEPEAREQRQRAFDPERTGRNDPEIVGRSDRRRRRPPAPAAASRGSTGIELTSSAKPTAAMNSVAPNSATGSMRSGVTALAMIAPATTTVAPITAMPPPCGVGTRCDERAFGLASACLTSNGRIARVTPAESNAAAGMARSDNWSAERVMVFEMAVTRGPRLAPHLALLFQRSISIPVRRMRRR